ncbi:MAG: hypothetical protein HYX90_02725 [Chloroflexi bacterium]|nr:hypothetical protein [Chloroflexota bacterium]
MTYSERRNYEEREPVVTIYRGLASHCFPARSMYPRYHTYSSDYGKAGASDDLIGIIFAGPADETHVITWLSTGLLCR